jgi:hypothetical protein
MAAKSALSTKDMGTNRIINLGNGVDPQDAAAYGQVQAAQSAAQAYTDSAIAGLASGQVLKGSVRAAVSTNVNLAAPGATLDGLTAANGEVYLLTAQTTGSQGGPYVFNGAAVPMTRATNWDTAGEAVVGSYWVVREGTQADRFALLTNDSFTLGTTTPTFTFTPIAAGGGTNGFAGAIPAASAGGTATVTHNLNTQDLIVQVRRTASPFDYVDIRMDAATVNTVNFLPDIAIGAGEFRALIRKAIDA